MKLTFPLFYDMTRVVYRRFTRLISPVKRYGENLDIVCNKILKDTYYDDFFHVSNGHFRNFFVRDFAIVTKHLMNLGYEKEVHSTIRFAFEQFMRAKRITTTITKTFVGYKAYDLPFFGFDSVALFIKSIVDSNYSLSDKERNFIERELFRMKRLYLENDLPKKSMFFSSIRDLQRRIQSAYDISMLAYIQANIKQLGINFHFDVNYKEYLLDNYWNGKFFYDDIKKLDYFSTDANIFPFWLDIINDESMFESIYSIILDKKLDEPYPIKYNSREDIEYITFDPLEFLMFGYERDNNWIHLGLVYLDVLYKFNKHDQLKRNLRSLESMIKEYGNFLEVFNDYIPYSNLFYYSDESLIWCASFFDLYRKVFNG